jgi:hypothetical protein
VSSTTSTVSDAEILSVAKHVFPAQEWALDSRTVYGSDLTEWSLSICIGRKTRDRRWKVVARGWSRSELLLKLRSMRPNVEYSDARNIAE